jgi:glucosamine--fructose-6-phosphate aminotransferase (isomerizing)
MLNRQPMTGAIGIGHTRWATHGRPSETNAHPHRAGDVVVVHNGIIENYLELKEQLTKRGTHFSSETDSEIVAHLVAEKVERGLDFLDAVRRTLREIHGSYALLFLNRRDPKRLIVAKNSTPIVIGWGEGETFIASDIPALLDYTRKVTFLEDGEIGEVTVGSYRLFDSKGKTIHRPVKEITWDAVAARKGGYPHFMLKEIHDQPRALADTFRGRISLKDGRVALEDIKFTASQVKQIKRIHLVACGTAWHACLVGKFMLEEIAGIPAEVDYGSEFRYRSPLMDPKSVLLMVSQSGETADTLAAVDIARAKRAKILSICNVIDSSIPRKSHGVLYTHAGPEISVASTKAFTTQLTALYLLAVALGRLNGKLNVADARKLLRDLMHLPSWIEKALEIEDEVKELARALVHSRDFLYLGRGINYPIALEGALKLKEISYIHAEGYPAGEMKHGPIALIDEKMPVVVLAPRDRYFQKTVSNLKEVESRGGRVVVLTDDAKTAQEMSGHRLLTVPKASHYLTPIVMTIPLQLLAYYIAVHRGTDVDQPRNLAKSVTVE